MAEAPVPGSDDPTSKLKTRHGICAVRPNNYSDLEKQSPEDDGPHKPPCDVTTAKEDLKKPIPVVQDESAYQKQHHKVINAEDVTPVRKEEQQIPSTAATTTESPKTFGELDFPEKECRMVLLGKTGHGKSSTGNTILGELAFKELFSMTSVTSFTTSDKTTMFGISIKVVDTPGVADTDSPPDDILREMSKCLALTSPGPHVLLFVIRIDIRFTKDEDTVLNDIKKVFGDNVMNHVVFVFTHGDAEKRASIDGILKTAPATLQTVLQEANQRYVVFDNKVESEKERQDQARKLLIVVRDMLKNTGGKHFSSSFLEVVDSRFWNTGQKIANTIGCDVNDDRVRALVSICVEDVEKDAKVLQQKLIDYANDLKEVKSRASQEKLELENELKGMKNQISDQRNKEQAAIRAQKDLQTKLQQAWKDLDNADKDKTKVHENIYRIEKELEEKKAQEQKAAEIIKQTNELSLKSQTALEKAKEESQKQQDELNNNIKELKENLHKTQKELKAKEWNCCIS